MPLRSGGGFCGYGIRVGLSWVYAGHRERGRLDPAGRVPREVLKEPGRGADLRASGCRGWRQNLGARSSGHAIGWGLLGGLCYTGRDEGGGLRAEGVGGLSTGAGVSAWEARRRHASRPPAPSGSTSSSRSQGRRGRPRSRQATARGCGTAPHRCFYALGVGRELAIHRR